MEARITCPEGHSSHTAQWRCRICSFSATGWFFRFFNEPSVLVLGACDLAAHRKRRASHQLSARPVSMLPFSAFS